MKGAPSKGPVEAEWVIGACILIKKEAWDDVGDFDSQFFLYREDTDWCYRAIKKGWKIIYHSDLVAIHHYKRESAKGINRQLAWHIISMIKFYKKHGIAI